MTQEPAAARSSSNWKPVHVILFAAWIAMAVGCFQPFYLAIFRLDIPMLREQWTELPYRKTPGLRSAVVEIAQRTPMGARILFWTPQRTWEGGYDYAFRRAQYLLAGRELLPMLADGRDVVDPRGAQAAQYIGCWPQCPPAPPGFAVVWEGSTGMLLRRIP